MLTDSPDREVDHAYLTDLVQKALDRPGLQVTDWKVQSIHESLQQDSAVFRYQGTAQEAGETIPWSLILKTIQPSSEASEPGGIWYCKREALRRPFLCGRK